MAELRKTQEQLVTFARTYTQIQCDERIKHLSPPSLKISIPESQEMEHDEQTNSAIPSTYASLLSQLESLKNELENVRPSTERLQKRLVEKDPVSNKPRYGEKTQARVSHLLSLFNELEEIIIITLFGGDSENAIKDAEPSDLVKYLRSQVDRELAEAEEQTRLAKLEEEKRLMRIADEERERREMQQREAEEAERARLREEEKIRVQQEEARRAEQQRRQEDEKRDRDWVNSITKGSIGVKQQLALLLESTAEDKQTQRCAIEALHTIFNQICARPEETNFRRIRRNHPKFNEV